MRIKDDLKREKVKQAVLNIVYENGLSGLNYSAIAKKANVSSGTPYVYYKDKCDMLSQIYMDAKNIIEKDLDNVIDEGKDIEDKLYKAVSLLISNMLEYPLEAKYILLLKNNKELLSEEAVQMAEQKIQPLYTLYEVAYKNGYIETHDFRVINALLIAPAMWLIEENRNITLQELESVISKSIQSILQK